MSAHTQAPDPAPGPSAKSGSTPPPAEGPDDCDDDDDTGDEDDPLPNPWYTDKTGLVFSFPPPDSMDKHWLDRMLEKVKANSGEIDNVLAQVKATLRERLSEVTLLEVETEQAVQEYTECSTRFPLSWARTSRASC